MTWHDIYICIHMINSEWKNHMNSVNYMNCNEKWLCGDLNQWKQEWNMWLYDMTMLHVVKSEYDNEWIWLYYMIPITYGMCYMIWMPVLYKCTVIIWMLV